MDNFEKKFNNIIRRWQVFEINFRDGELKLVERTKSLLSSVCGDDSNYYLEFIKLDELRKSIDFHPLESGAYDEIDKWNIFKTKLLKLLNSVMENI